ncbi:hypothetical protein F5Y01DRAFT_323078 [Xylaria sp. FL0043]|nr:hypothetical protein F5Y01DRAFT_323078 [Xylaria sp. FL0043]
MLLSGLLGVKKSEGGHQRRTPGGMLVRGVATGIGLASEAHHHHKEKNAAKGGERDTGAPLTDGPAAYGNSNTQPMTLSQPAVMQEEPQSSATDNNQPPQLAEAFLQAHPSPSTAEVRTEPLALPVVITQRRPGKRTEGFVRAYAPILNDVGISEATFLEFMDDLNKAVMPSPWIQALNLAALAGLAAPQPFTVLISLAVQQATNAASAAHSRYKTNNFLNQVNRSFFMPRGLIALIMTWKPSEPGPMMTDMNFDMEPMIKSVAKGDEQSPLRKMKNKFAQSNGATALEWLETAPLVFPVLDNLSAADAQKKQNVLKRAGDFVGEYMDSRSSAQWAGQNPDSKMANAGPKEQFHSRYSDPNYPASSGDPVALLTGGHFQSLLSGGRGILSRGIDRQERGGLNGPIRMISGVGGIGVGAGAVKKIFEKVAVTHQYGLYGFCAETIR